MPRTLHQVGKRQRVAGAAPPTRSTSTPTTTAATPSRAPAGRRRTAAAASASATATAPPPNPVQPPPPEEDPALRPFSLLAEGGGAVFSVVGLRPKPRRAGLAVEARLLARDTAQLASELRRAQAAAARRIQERGDAAAALAASAARHVEAAARQERLRLLRQGDDSGYRALLEDARNEKYAQLVQQTEGILTSLGIAAGDQAAGPPPLLPQPALLQWFTLKPYQREGVSWLHANTQRGMNSVLADEMGLGKTAQTIALFCKLAEGNPRYAGGAGVGGTSPSHPRFLVCAPLSTLDNWMAELRRGAPFFRCLKFHAPKDSRWEMCRSLPGFDVVVTQYASLQHPSLKDMLKALQGIKWTYVVVDEGHRLSNVESTFSQNIRTIQADHRLLLTGTPLQNDVHELWALLNFLMPTLFKNPASFDEWFPSSSERGGARKKGKGGEGEGEGEEEKLLMARRLHSLLRPFLLRREKRAVLRQLPEKREITLRAPLSPFQLSLYRQVAQHQVIGALDSGGSPQRIGCGVYMALRKICLHPLLICGSVAEEVYDRLIIPSSGKLELLHRILMKLKAGGHKVLIFTQFSQMLDILEEHFKVNYGWAREKQYERLDGAVASEDRCGSLVRFQGGEPESFVFILTTRAGGQGINLQAADTVIFYDMDWNPQQDLQAMARAHRLGQKRDVLVLKLVTDAPVEQHMCSVAGVKLEKEALAIQAGLYDQNSTEDMRDEKIKEVLAAPVSAEVLNATSEEELDEALARDAAEHALLQSDEQRVAAKATPLTVLSDLPAGYEERQAAAVESRRMANLTPEEQALRPLGPRESTLKVDFSKYAAEAGSAAGSSQGGGGSPGDSGESSGSDDHSDA